MLKTLIAQENKIRHVSFQQTTKENLKVKRNTEIKEIIRMSKNIDEDDLDLEKADEMCCQQCNTPVPLVCWRFSIKFFLQSTQLRNPTEPPKKDLLASALDFFSGKEDLLPDADDLRPFWAVDGWRSSLLDFIENSSGHASRDAHWILNFFEFTESVKPGAKATMRSTVTDP